MMEKETGFSCITFSRSSYSITKIKFSKILVVTYNIIHNKISLYSIILARSPKVFFKIKIKC